MSNLDEYYSYDALSRLNQMQRGTLNSTKTGIVGTPALEQDWTLDPTGNWNGYQNQTSGTTSLSQTRSHSKVNAITGITSTPFWPTPPGYDAAGNTRFFPSAQNPQAAMRGVYDAWNRLVAVDAGDDLEEDLWGSSSSSSSSSGSSLLSRYSYDGFNRRIAQTDYSSGSGQSVDYYFSFNWQLLQEIGEGETDRQYVYGIRYVDEMVCFDPMGTPTYICQDANWNVTSLVGASGDVLEHYSYTPYGVQSVYDGSWNPEEESSYDWQFGHQGLYLDDVTDLYYNRNRWLHPQLGREL